MALISLLETSVGEGERYSQARMVGAKKILRGARATGLAEPESSTTRLLNWSDHGVPASERGGRAFGEERSKRVVRSPAPETSGGAWRDRGCDSGL